MKFSQETLGSSRPSPPTTIMLERDTAYLLLRKSFRDDDSRTGYLGIGKYEITADPGLKQKFFQLAEVLSSRPLPSPRPGRHQNVIRYDFELGGVDHSGVYDLSLGSEFNARLRPFAEIRDELLSRGSPVIGLHPKLQAEASPGAITILLTIINTGRTPLELVGPSGWGRADEGSQATVTVGITSLDGADWLYDLDEEHLVDDRDKYAKVISIHPDQSVRLKFRYPVEERGRLAGKYSVAARMSAIILAPSEFQGVIETGLDSGTLVY
ncbi:hypothetical protein [Novilysobacter spongiicola]|uniref:Uncharacterized protein n=1 Tax=Lysobacter spongiicola DSM 21749 TaxID=1122188 RepID=A0A1T4NR86_9GAMM|nr:hypothetical protein [Lysobacter spongiicola]SJZ81645.1 hypothetical protein SAMN02745674_00865 [Lysobacter spongiicola DSM 21749]